MATLGRSQKIRKMAELYIYIYIKMAELYIYIYIYIYILNIYTEISIEENVAMNCSAAILVETIFERIRSVHARIAIDVLSMYGNLYGREWYVNKNNVTSILLVHSIKLITLFIFYPFHIVNTCAGIDIFNTKILMK